MQSGGSQGPIDTPVMMNFLSSFSPHVHWGRWGIEPAEGFPMGGMEFQVVLLLTALYFVVMGNGAGSSQAS